jgi:hypothetical protein
VSLVIAAGASFAAPRIDEALARAARARAPSPAVDICVSALRAFTLLFFVPSLSLRYWGAHPTAAACGLVLVLAGFGAGAASALRRSRVSAGNAVRLVFAGAAAMALAGWAAHLAFVTAGLVLPELLLARLSLSFLAVAIVIFRAGEIALCWGAHETKASADEA